MYMRCTLIFQLGSQLGIQCCYPSKDGALFADPQMKLEESWVSFQEAQSDGIGKSRSNFYFFKCRLSGFYHIQKYDTCNVEKIIKWLREMMKTKLGRATGSSIPKCPRYTSSNLEKENVL